MSGDLTILNYTGNPPTTKRDIDDAALRPLGTMSDLRALLIAQFPDIEWESTPSLLSIVKQSGSESWRDWSPEELAHRSQPSVSAHSHNDEFMISFYGLPVDHAADVKHLLVEMHAAGNPYRPLKVLCSSNGWVAVGPNPDDQFIDFDEAIAAWDDFEQNESAYLDEARQRDQKRLAENEAFSKACVDFTEAVLMRGFSCPKCDVLHDQWRCIVPSRPDRRAYFICTECGRSIEKADLEEG